MITHSTSSLAELETVPPAEYMLSLCIRVRVGLFLSFLDLPSTHLLAGDDASRSKNLPEATNQQLTKMLLEVSWQVRWPSTVRPTR